jgi:hypothetical protein
VGLPQAIPAGSPPEVPSAGGELGLATTAAGVGLAVGEEELDPQRASATPATATPSSTTGLRFTGPSCVFTEGRVAPQETSLN